MEYSINEIERLKNEINSLKIENKVPHEEYRKQNIEIIKLTGENLFLKRIKSIYVNQYNKVGCIQQRKQPIFLY